MVEVIKEAYKQSFKNTFEIDLLESEEGIFEGYVSSIKAIKNGIEEEIFFIFSKEMLLCVSGILLMDHNPDENTLGDLCKELANIVVGVAKVVASDMGIDFHISTPTFLGITSVQPHDRLSLSYIHEGATCTTILGR